MRPSLVTHLHRLLQAGSQGFPTGRLGQGGKACTGIYIHKQSSKLAVLSVTNCETLNFTNVCHNKNRILAVGSDKLDSRLWNEPHQPLLNVMNRTVHSLAVLVLQWWFNANLTMKLPQNGCVGSSQPLDGAPSHIHSSAPSPSVRWLGTLVEPPAPTKYIQTSQHTGVCNPARNNSEIIRPYILALENK